MCNVIWSSFGKRIFKFYSTAVFFKISCNTKKQHKKTVCLQQASCKRKRKEKRILLCKNVKCAEHAREHIFSRLANQCKYNINLRKPGVLQSLALVRGDNLFFPFY